MQDPKHSRGLFHGLIPSLCLLAASAVLPATAVELEDHDHAVLPIDATMTLTEVVDRTVEYAWVAAEWPDFPDYDEVEAALADR